MDNTKKLYFMENLNPMVIEQTILMRKSTLTRRSFPNTYAELKTHIINEYNAQMTDSEHAKVVLNVIKNSPNKKMTEFSMMPQDNDQKGQRFLCGNKNHKMKKCWYYDASKSLENNRRQLKK
jgi:hypothetical protein